MRKFFGWVVLLAPFWIIAFIMCWYESFIKTVVAFSITFLIAFVVLICAYLGFELLGED